MQKFYINYANDDFKQQQNNNTKQVKEIGKVEAVISYGRDDIDKDFYAKNKKILNKVRGGGYWLWKFYFIHKTLTDATMKKGDVLFYCDSGVNVLKDLNPLYTLPKKYNQDVILFDTSDKNKSYTKRDTFMLMNCDTNDAYDANVCIGGIHLWRKSAKSIAFIEECLEYATQYKIIGDSISTLGQEHPEFICHRHDQSIFSLMAYKKGLLLVSNVKECVYDTSVKNANDSSVDFKNPRTYLIPNRVHNRNWLARLKYKLAMLPEKMMKRGGFIGYIKHKLGI